MTFNMAMDLDLANGARGHIVDIVLDEREEAPDERTHCMRLQYLPLYMLAGVLPVAPLTRTFVVTMANQKSVDL